MSENLSQAAGRSPLPAQHPKQMRWPRRSVSPAGGWVSGRGGAFPEPVQSQSRVRQPPPDPAGGESYSWRAGPLAAEGRARAGPGGRWSLRDGRTSTRGGEGRAARRGRRRGEVGGRGQGRGGASWALGRQSGARRFGCLSRARLRRAERAGGRRSNSVSTRAPISGSVDRYPGECVRTFGTVCV